MPNEQEKTPHLIRLLIERIGKIRQHKQGEPSQNRNRQQEKDPTAKTSGSHGSRNRKSPSPKHILGHIEEGHPDIGRAIHDTIGERISLRSWGREVTKEKKKKKKKKKKEKKARSPFLQAGHPDHTTGPWSRQY